MTQLIKYSENFKLKMSTKDEFVLSKSEMQRFENMIINWGVFKKEDWTLINPSFFITASPFQSIDWLTLDMVSELEARKIRFKEALWRKPKESEILVWIEKLKKNLPI